MVIVVTKQENLQHLTIKVFVKKKNLLFCLHCAEELDIHQEQIADRQTDRPTVSQFSGGEIIKRMRTKLFFCLFALQVWLVLFTP